MQQAKGVFGYAYLVFTFHPKPIAFVVPSPGRAGRWCFRWAFSKRTVGAVVCSVITPRSTRRHHDRSYMRGGAPSAMFQRDDACWEQWPWCLLVQPPRRHRSLGRSQPAQPHEPLSRTGHCAGRRAILDLHTPPSQPRGATKLQTAAPSQPGWHTQAGVRRGRFAVADVAHSGRLAILICASRQARVKLAARGVAAGGRHGGIALGWAGVCGWRWMCRLGPEAARLRGCEAATGGFKACGSARCWQPCAGPAFGGMRHATIPAPHAAGGKERLARDAPHQHPQTRPQTAAPPRHPCRCRSLGPGRLLSFALPHLVCANYTTLALMRRCSIAAVTATDPSVCWQPPRSSGLCAWPLVAMLNLRHRDNEVRVQNGRVCHRQPRHLVLLTQRRRDRISTSTFAYTNHAPAEHRSYTCTVHVTR